MDEGKQNNRPVVTMLRQGEGWDARRTKKWKMKTTTMKKMKKMKKMKITITIMKKMNLHYKN